MKIYNNPIKFQKINKQQCNKAIKTIFTEDKLNGITCMEREIVNPKTGKKATASVITSIFPDGTRYSKTTITGDGVNITRKKKIKIQNNSNIYGGDKISIKKSTKFEEYNIDSNKVKEYDRADNLRQETFNSYKVSTAEGTKPSYHGFIASLNRHIGQSLRENCISPSNTTKMEKNIINSATGKKAVVNVETKTLPDGTKFTKTKIEGGGTNPISREKSIEILENASSYDGGDKITINKEYTKFNEYNIDSTRIKDYDRAGNLKNETYNYQIKTINSEI